MHSPYFFFFSLKPLFLAVSAVPFFFHNFKRQIILRFTVRGQKQAINSEYSDRFAVSHAVEWVVAQTMIVYQGIFC